VRICAGAWKGCGELVTARNCLRMPLWSETTGAPYLPTVQNRSQSASSFTLRDEGSRATHNEPLAGSLAQAKKVRTCRGSTPLGCLWKQRSIVTIRTDDSILR